MHPVSLVVVIEGGQMRSYGSVAFRLPLPDCMVWGTSVIARIEDVADEVDSWPSIGQLEAFVIIDRDGRRLIHGGSSENFATPYQLSLFRKMLRSVWPGYAIASVALTEDAIQTAVDRELPVTDPSLAGELFSAVVDSIDRDDEQEVVGREQDDQEQDDEVRAGDRGLATTSRQLDNDEDDLDDMDDEELWWMSCRLPDETSEAGYRHILGGLVGTSLRQTGPDLLDQIRQLPESDIPEEEETTRGIVLDGVSREITIWSHPRGVGKEFESLGTRWADWRVVHWQDDGFRQQLAKVGQQTYIPATDTEVLSGFVPTLIEQPDFDEAIGELKSAFRAVAWKGFGCLAMVLAVPATIAWGLSGSWQGPFGFAVGLWLVAYLGYRLVVWKLKAAFSPLTEGLMDQDAVLPKLAPEPKEERERLVDEALAAAGLPRLAEVVAYDQFRDDDADDGGEAIEPIIHSD